MKGLDRGRALGDRLPFAMAAWVPASGGRKVFISSTYLDNEARRELVRDAVERAGIVPVGMERFGASPRPTVEQCCRLAAECDIFVGIVAHRYGWEPDASGKSITWLEYDAAKAAERPRLMFEIDRSLPWTDADLDPGEDCWAKQEKLKEFREDFREDQMPALFREETLHGAVIQSLHEHLARIEPRAEPPLEPLPASTDAALAKAIGLYREAMLVEHGSIELAGFKTKLRVPIALEDLYIPLQAMVDRRAYGDAAFPNFEGAKPVLDQGGSDEIPLFEAFQQAQRLRRTGLVILGDPGSGKTTHL